MLEHNADMSGGVQNCHGGKAHFGVCDLCMGVADAEPHAAAGEGVGYPVRALLVFLASGACMCIGIWLICDDEHLPLSPSYAPAAQCNVCAPACPAAQLKY